MKFWYFLLVVSLVVQISIEDDCHTREIDLCAVTALLSLRDTPVPQTDEEADNQCSYIKETVDCIHNFTNKCLTVLYKELFNRFSTGAISSINDYCTPGSNLRKSVLKHSSCLAKAWKEQRSCIVDAQAGLEVLNEAPSDNRIDMLCCVYRRYYDCATATARKICGDDIQKFIDDIIKRVALNIPATICKSCDGSDECHAMIPLPGTPPKGTHSESPISQLIAMYLN